jgi:hypothetical protein
VCLVVGDSLPMVDATVPDLMYMQAEPPQARAAMLQAGLSADAVDQMEEMARWLSAFARTSPPGPVEVTPTTLEQFAPQFREAFEALPALA